MLVSLCILGFGAVGKEVYRQLKAVPGFNVDWRIHTIYVPDMSKYAEAKKNSNHQWKINDETFETELETTIGDDLEWLLSSDGHDTVVDCTPYSDGSRELVFNLLNRGYWLHACSKGLVSNHWKELVDLAENKSAKYYFNSIPSGDPSKYTAMDLTQGNFAEYADDHNLYIYRNGDAEATAGIIVRDIVKEIDRRRANKALGVGW
jgi:homoserine dehydrogenase